MTQVYIKVLLLIISMWTTVGCSAKMPDGGPHDVQTTDIIAQLNKGANIDVDSCVVRGDLDFTLIDGVSRIALSMRQARDSYIAFTDCVFIGKVTAFGKTLTGRTVFSRNLSFVRCDFRDEVDFTESVVEGNVFPTGSTFRKKASWQGAGFRHRKVCPVPKQQTA